MHLQNRETELLVNDFLSQMNEMVEQEDLRAIGVSLENFHETYDTPEVQAYVSENAEESLEIDVIVQKAQTLVSIVHSNYLLRICTRHLRSKQSIIVLCYSTSLNHDPLKL